MGSTGIPEGAPRVIPRLFCGDPVARVLSSPTDQFWGDRTAWVLDPAGHVWTLATRIEETTEQERQARLARLNQSPQ